MSDRDGGDLGPRVGGGGTKEDDVEFMRMEEVGRREETRGFDIRVEGDMEGWMGVGGSECSFEVL